MMPFDRSTDHATLLARLTRQKRQALSGRSNGKGLVRMTVHWGAIVAVGTLIYLQPPFWQGLLPLQGLLIISTFSLLHEAIHKTPFKSRWLNTVAAQGSGLLIMIMPLWFRHFHMDHHRYTNNPEKDPELVLAKPTTWSQYLWHLTGLPVWWSQIRTIVVNACNSRGSRDSFVPQKDWFRVRLEAFRFLALYAALAGGSVYLETMTLVWVWLVPVILGQPFLRAYLLAEHGGCPFTDNMLANTRTTLTNIIVRFFMWNMPYHIEHHMFPAIPFHKLPAFHAWLQPHPGVVTDGYVDFHKSFTRSFTRSPGNAGHG